MWILLSVVAALAASVLLAAWLAYRKAFYSSPRHREELTDAINTQIILRYRYSAGVAQYNLSDDNDAKAAVELLGNPEEYSRILREQDTARQHDRDE